MKYEYYCNITTTGLRCRRKTHPKAVANVVALCVTTVTTVILGDVIDLCSGFVGPSTLIQRPKGSSKIHGWKPIRYNNNNDLQQLISSSVTTSTTSSKLMMGMWSQNDEIEGSDRIKACIPYLLPLIDGDHFGEYIYTRIPIMNTIDQITIGPLAELARSIPFLSLGLFIALTLGTRFNTNMSRNLRFSAQQAALIDVALLFPELIGSGFVEDPLPRYIVEPCSNFVWYAYMSIVIYCLVSNLRGKKPDQIPYLSNAADLMVGPF